MRGVGRQGTLVVNVSLGLGVGTLLGAWMTWGPWDLGLGGLWRGSIVGTAVTGGSYGQHSGVDTGNAWTCCCGGVRCAILCAGCISASPVTRPVPAAFLNLVILVMVDWPLEVQQARNIQTMQLGVRARQQMIYRALRVGAATGSVCGRDVLITRGCAWCLLFVMLPSVDTHTHTH